MFNQQPTWADPASIESDQLLELNQALMELRSHHQRLQLLDEIGVAKLPEASIVIYNHFMRCLERKADIKTKAAAHNPQNEVFRNHVYGSQELDLRIGFLGELSGDIKLELQALNFEASSAIRILGKRNDHLAAEALVHSCRYDEFSIAHPTFIDKAKDNPDLIEIAHRQLYYADEAFRLELFRILGGVCHASSLNVISSQWLYSSDLRTEAVKAAGNIIAANPDLRSNAEFLKLLRLGFEDENAEPKMAALTAYRQAYGEEAIQLLHSWLTQIDAKVLNSVIHNLLILGRSGLEILLNSLDHPNQFARAEIGKMLYSIVSLSHTPWFAKGKPDDYQRYVRDPNWESLGLKIADIATQGTVNNLLKIVSGETYSEVRNQYHGTILCIRQRIADNDFQPH
jgi:hypothetical protein